MMDLFLGLVQVSIGLSAAMCIAYAVIGLVAVVGVLTLDWRRDE
jgi:hypothetical protein